MRIGSWEVSMARLVVAGGVLMGLGLFFLPAQAQDSSTARVEIRVAAACIGCQAKCRKCAAEGFPGGRFNSLEACIADCKAHGNPSVDPTCSAYRACR